MKREKITKVASNSGIPIEKRSLYFSLVSEHEAEEGDNGGDGENGEENFVVHIGEHRLDQTADQGAHAAGELENGEEQTVVFARHVGETCL